MFKIAIIASFFILMSTMSYANNYWISTNGGANWEDAKSNVPLLGEECTTLDQANENAVAGDVINIRGGTYNTQISPTNSGTSGNPITYQSYNDETVIFSGISNACIYLHNDDYIKIDGINFVDNDRWPLIRNFSDYNEIVNCTFSDSDGHVIAPMYIRGACGDGSSNCPSTNNWIHNCTFYGIGYVNPVTCNDEGSLIYVGTSTPDDEDSNNNTFEDNLMYNGGHHLYTSYTEKNVFRNNVLHNEGWMDDPGGCELGPSSNGKYGNRCIAIVDYHNREAVYNLVEGNRMGHSGASPDDNGSNVAVFTSKRNLIRYNVIYNSDGDGMYFKNNDSSERNIIYNNTIYKSGQGPSSRTDLRRNGITLSVHDGKKLYSDEHQIINNLFYGNAVNECKTLEVIHPECNYRSSLRGNWLHSGGDPLFINTDVSDPTSSTAPDLRLSKESGAIDKGSYLTMANGSGNDSSKLVVDEALFFQDGSWGSALAGHQADWIAIDSSSKVVQISSIDYSTNTITLTKAMTWNDNDKIYLFKKSDGKQVLVGNYPDIGAYEYGSANSEISAVKNFYIVEHQ